jgi:hypothetical protein
VITYLHGKGNVDEEGYRKGLGDVIAVILFHNALDLMKDFLRL